MAATALMGSERRDDGERAGERTHTRVHAHTLFSVSARGGLLQPQNVYVLFPSGSRPESMTFTLNFQQGLSRAAAI